MNIHDLETNKVRKAIASDLLFVILNYSDFGQVYLLQTETRSHIYFVGTRPYTILQRHLETKVEKTFCKNFTPFLSRLNSVGGTLPFICQTANIQSVLSTFPQVLVLPFESITRTWRNAQVSQFELDFDQTFLAPGL